MCIRDRSYIVLPRKPRKDNSCLNNAAPRGGQHPPSASSDPTRLFFGEDEKKVPAEHCPALWLEKKILAEEPTRPRNLPGGHSYGRWGKNPPKKPGVFLSGGAGRSKNKLIFGLFWGPASKNFLGSASGGPHRVGTCSAKSNLITNIFPGGEGKIRV